MNRDAPSKVHQAYARHQLRLRGLDMCKALLELIQNLQQHRGASLAVLGGDHFFETRIQSLEPYIMNALKRIDRDRHAFIDPVEWRSIYSEWFTVHRQWRQDNAIHNFELHTHLIQEVQKQIWQVVVRSGHLEHFAHHRDAAKFVLQDLPQIMEAIAQLRGLATHAAASGAGDIDFKLRLEYLCRDISEQFDRLDQTLLSQESSDPRYWRQRDTLAAAQERWNALKQRVQSDILAPARIETSPDATFSDASLIISHLYSLVLMGIRQLRTSVDEDMQQWISASMYD